MTNPAFVVLVQVTVRPELCGEFERAVLENAARSVEEEPGCVRFEVSRREDDPAQFVLYEVYTDAAAWEAHRQQPHFLAYQQVAQRALVSRTAVRCRGVNVTVTT